jgi:D-lactate dehydrogenase (cytochrome)
MIAPLVGHVGDGNFHMLLLTKLSDDVERAQAHGVVARLADRALRLGGTCTGEHGVGMGKMEALSRQHGDAIEAMRAIKGALDPRNLMNPGKILASPTVA